MVTIIHFLTHLYLYLVNFVFDEVMLCRRSLIVCVTLFCVVIITIINYSYFVLNYIVPIRTHSIEPIIVFIVVVIL